MCIYLGQHRNTKINRTDKQTFNQTKRSNRGEKDPRCEKNIMHVYRKSSLSSAILFVFTNTIQETRSK